MYQAKKCHKHRPPCAGQRPHAPDGERTDQCIGENAAQSILPFSAEHGKQTDERCQSKLKIQIRRKHGAQDAKQDKKQLCAWV